MQSHPSLAKLVGDEPLSLYVSINSVPVNAILVKEEANAQLPI